MIPRWLATIEARAMAATPGPWLEGVDYWEAESDADGQCRNCGGDTPLMEVRPEANQLWHVHRWRLDRRRYPHWWTEIASDGVHETVCGGNYGGVVCRADAEFIAHAREDIPRLLAEIHRLRAKCSPHRRPPPARGAP